MYEEEEENYQEEEQKPEKIAKVSIFNPNLLFSNEAKSFSFRKDDDISTPKIQATKDWKQIAFDFLNNDDDYLEIGSNESYTAIDVSRSSEFVAGQGAKNWGEIRRQALENSKEKKRRANK